MRSATINLPLKLAWSALSLPLSPSAHSLLAKVDRVHVLDIRCHVRVDRLRTQGLVDRQAREGLRLQEGYLGLGCGERLANSQLLNGGRSRCSGAGAVGLDGL